jgi:hypothetical protein
VEAQAFAEIATGPPTGSLWDGPPVAAAWTGSTGLMRKPSKTSTSTHWSATPGNVSAAISRGKQIRFPLIGIRLASPHHADLVVGEFEMSAGKLVLRHMTRNAVLGADRACGGVRLSGGWRSTLMMAA